MSGRSTIGDEDLEIILTIALSSMPENRRRAFSILLDPPGDLNHSERGEVTSSDLERCFPCSRPTAIKVLNELALLEIGHLKEGYGNEPTRLKLKDKLVEVSPSLTFPQEGLDRDGEVAMSAACESL
ncbi:MAG: hypothetical protein IIB05_11080, partial [Bacteroidetes bacterium]|nr:hypothetical protein [Bacteroidota bacterium]